MARGKFITIEGIEGVGKSTQCEFVVECISAAGHEVISTREPGGTDLGERIRALLLSPSLPPMAPITELLLMFAARAEHLDKVIAPALAHGNWVVCDRFTDATYAYQGGGRGLDKQAIATLEAFAQRGLRPDLTLLLDAPVETALSRAKARGQADRFELEQIEFFERIRDTYLEVAAREPRRVTVIEAGHSIEQVRAEIRQILSAILQ